MTPRKQAEDALHSLKVAILNFLAACPAGATNLEITQALNLYSDFEGKQKNYLSWSVLGLLLGEGKIRYERSGRSKIYFVKE